MPAAVKGFVRLVDAVNRVVGLFAMYLVFAMMAVLIYSAYTRAAGISEHWMLETAQFLMVAYFLLGGPYSMQTDSNAHVRMDLVYGRWSARTRAIVDSFTILFLIFYLGVLLYGAIRSVNYALAYNETSYSAWSPPMAPIKIIMAIAILLMLLQAIATFFRNLAEARGEPLP